MFDQKKVNVTTCDNGFIVEWSQPRDDHQRYVSDLVVRHKKYSGVEVFTKLKDAIKFAETKL